MRRPMVAAAVVLLPVLGCGSPATDSLLLQTVATQQAQIAELQAAVSRTPTASPTSAPVLTAPTPATFVDPFAYCATVETIDEPDARYTGPRLITVAARRSLQRLWPTRDLDFVSITINWRCMDRQLLVCEIGANNPCWKVDVGREPNAAMLEFCRMQPNAPFIGKVDTGHSTIYDWKCTNGVPAITGQIFHTDPRGFASELWHRITP